MDDILSIVSETVDILFHDFNYGRSETKNIMPYCRFAVEKYIFEKIFNTLYSMYIIKNKASIEKFSTKLDEICNKLTIIDMFKFLEVFLYDIINFNIFMIRFQGNFG